MTATNFGKRFLTFCLLVLMVLVASSTTTLVRGDEVSEDSIDDGEEAHLVEESHDDPTDAAVDNSAAEAAAAAAEQMAAEAEAAEAEAARVAAAEEAATAKAAEEAATETKPDIWFVLVSKPLTAITDKSKSLIESVKSMTPKQKKQSVAFVAASGFGAAFVSGRGKGNGAGKK